MSDAIAAALVAAGASVTGSVLAYIVGIRSLRRSMSSSDGVPIGKFVETRIGGLERRLERIEDSLADVREFLAYQRGRNVGPLWSPEASGHAQEGGG